MQLLTTISTDCMHNDTIQYIQLYEYNTLQCNSYHRSSQIYRTPASYVYHSNIKITCRYYSFICPIYYNLDYLLLCWSYCKFHTGLYKICVHMSRTNPSHCKRWTSFWYDCIKTSVTCHIVQVMICWAKAVRSMQHIAVFGIVFM